jgi:hypothetical protein
MSDLPLIIVLLLVPLMVLWLVQMVAALVH